ncbi:MAG: 16S rRNA (adenine(1518)-N(6)/adenine(1519)-N(6))-dimethyltransferase [Candidatus Spechtbacteria bacterium]|nr:16S rRNA (adenine(1518)-N(6)/adenine(1519)-N(6))-dimethyltransferase [Candidatus Spechtbacteria bacterium]
MLTPSEIKEIYLQHDILMPNKRLGQNFLVNQDILNALIAAAQLDKNDTVLEIGGGLGTVTTEIAKYVGRVVTIEKDRALIPILREQTANYKNIEIIEGDALRIQNTEYRIQDYKLVGTPPYYLTARLFRKFLDEEPIRPSRIAVIIQKEVAQKICAKTPDMNPVRGREGSQRRSTSNGMNLLALSVQLYGNPTIVRIVSKGAFWPQPTVDSALLVVDVYPSPVIAEKDIPLFFKIAKAGFAHPRQQLQKTLSQGLGLPKEKITIWLAQNDIEQTRRPETLSLNEWKTLVNRYPL